ncbi:cation:proton antiporter regulatory subunit [Streptomyces sp. NBC_01525]|uniref:Cation:proton antiporter regulatory subunit n=1 Tax=Streptomyces benahoarensis TaxID=2595054 RepID=A0A553ZM56_9ACTN|nr:TrkA C-terminal domain-containing protein [Streptomyces benahoarensis]TSB23685.1 cation:proton antiporter regulatory subunit [Streptomyces benahoarensis]TSB42564.1 cation:proton antiporter regulatory subunit [Streptomyces benahoarensis]
MEPSAHVGKTALPGVGTRYDLDTDGGRHVSVVAHQDGRRILAFHDPQDEDSCQDSVALAPQEASTLSKLLFPDPVAHLHQHPEIDLVTEHIPVTKRSPYAGRTLGATAARTRTGASIVAVLRRTDAVPSPTPDFRFAIGDTLVVVGTREGVDAVAALITGG